MSIESVMPSNHLILCHPLLFLPSIFPSIWAWFPVRWLFTSGGQSTGASASASASASVLPINVQGWFPSVYPWPLKICGIQPALSCLVQHIYTTPSDLKKILTECVSRKVTEVILRKDNYIYGFWVWKQAPRKWPKDDVHESSKTVNTLLTKPCNN